MKMWSKVFVMPVVLLLIVFVVNTLLAESCGTGKPSKAEVVQKTQKLRIPFIANEGQTDEGVRFYANTFGGTVFVTKDGEIVYSLPAGREEGRQGSRGDEEQGGKGEKQEAGSEKQETGWHGQALLVHAESEFAANGYVPLFHADNVNCPPGRVLAKSLLAAYLPGLQEGTDKQSLSMSSHSNPGVLPESPIRGVALKEHLVGGRNNKIQGIDRAVTKVNYFRGNDPSQWKTNISAYDVVALGEVYEGIELKLKAYGNNVEKLFCVKPGASPEQIKIGLSGIQSSENPPPLSPSLRGTGVCPPLAGAGGGLGARGLWVNEHGELVAETELGPVKFTKPVAYQEIDGKRVDVAVEYCIQTFMTEGKEGRGSVEQRGRGEEENSKLETPNSKLTYGFTVASYDTTKDLIIDPLLASTFLPVYFPRGIAIDSEGNVYMVNSPILKFSADLSQLLEATFLVEPGHGDVSSITVDSSGNVYVAGTTDSSGFPTTQGAYDTSFNGGLDIFVSKLNSDLTNLLASTYLGGFSDESGTVKLDSAGNVYIVGSTNSSNFPTTPGAYNTTYHGDDVFVSKLNSNLTSLLSSTFLGETTPDHLSSMAIDAGGNVYVVGDTGSSDFPTTPGAYDTSYNGVSDVVIVKFSKNLSNLLASTFLGGSDGESSTSIVLDSAGNVYVTGYIYSSSSGFSDFPTTPGAYDTTGEEGSTFVSKLSGDLTSLVASTFFGGDIINSIAIESGAGLYIVGEAVVSGVPTTPGAYNTFSPWGGVFISRFTSDLTSLLASTYVGGSDVSYFGRIAIDPWGNVYVTGITVSSDYPTTPGAYDTSFNGHDAFISKFDSNLSAGDDSDAHYAFDEGVGTIAVDSSGNGNNGTIHGPAWTSGKRLYGLSFDGANDYVSIPFMNHDEVSISAWFYKNAHDTTSADAIFGAWRWNSNPQLQEGFDVRFPQNSPNKLEFFLVTQDGSGNRTTKTAWKKFINSVGSWYHVTGTYNKTTGEQNLYVNGQLVHTQTHPPGNTIVPLSYYPDMRIGHSRVNNGYLYGVIDDVILYRRALSNREVLGLYDAFAGDLQANYTFDEGHGTIANDSSGNGNHGTVNGAAWEAGKSAGGLSFDGINDYVSVPRMNHDEISISAWFCKHANDTTHVDAIFGAWRSSSNMQLREGFDLRFPPDAPDTLEFILITRDAQGTRKTVPNRADLGNSVGSWYHVVGTYNKTTGEQKLYVNSQLADIQTHPPGSTIVPLTSYPDMRIGHSRMGAGYFNGVIDGVRLYNRALSDSEVQDIYNNP